jgi:transglutaminase-like putative cysteine protease
MKMRRFAALPAVLVSLTMLTALPVQAAGFESAGDTIVYRNDDGTIARDTFVYQDGKTFYAADDGALQFGLTKVGDKTYYFPADGDLSYGWHDFGEQVSYVKRDGSLVTSDTVEGAQVDANGAAVSAVTKAYDPAEVSTMTDPAFYEEVESTLQTIVTPGLSSLEQLRQVYDWEIANYSYLRNPAIPDGDWTTEYAKEILESHQGNCYRYTSSFAYFAKALGFDSRIVTGHINASPHGYCVITIDGTDYIFDPVMGDGRHDPDGFWQVLPKNYKRPFVPEKTWTVAF